MTGWMSMWLKAYFHELAEDCVLMVRDAALIFSACPALDSDWPHRLATPPTKL